MILHYTKGGKDLKKEFETKEQLLLFLEKENLSQEKNHLFVFDN